MKRALDNISWREMTFLRPITSQEIVDAFTHISELKGRKAFILEIRSCSGKTHYSLGAEAKDIRSIIKLVESHKKFRFSKTKIKRKEIHLAKEILLSPQSLSLKTSKQIVLLELA
ncbi:hypothetical protein ACT3K8_002733 [Listeria monocytogenes]|nr:hypothetical protein FZ082_12860 [Listeria monocytogenes]